MRKFFALVMASGLLVSTVGCDGLNEFAGEIAQGIGTGIFGALSQLDCEVTDDKGHTLTNINAKGHLNHNPYLECNN